MNDAKDDFQEGQAADGGVDLAPESAPIGVGPLPRSGRHGPMAALLRLAIGHSWRWVAAMFVIVGLVGVSWMGLRDSSSVAPASDSDPDVVATETVDRNLDFEAEIELAEEEYTTAITSLETVAEAGGDELDTETAEVLQANLTVIDEAIGESRAALEAEPADEVAQLSLFEGLRQKVVLLQETVALINEMRKGDQEGAARIVSEINQ